MGENPTRRRRACATGGATLAMVLMVTACGTKPPVHTDASPPKLQRACPAVDEVTGLPMIEIDLTDRVWTIPPTRMKATREHRVPLCCVDAPWRFSTRRKLVVTK